MSPLTINVECDQKGNLNLICSSAEDLGKVINANVQFVLNGIACTMTAGESWLNLVNNYKKALNSKGKIKTATSKR